MKVVFITEITIMATTTHTPVCGTIHMHFLREKYFFIFIALTIEGTFSPSHMRLENCSLLSAPVTPKQLDNCFR